MEILRKIIKSGVTRIYKPILSKYLSSERKYEYKGIHLAIPPEVFHPAFFFSTKILLKYIAAQPLHKKKLLELGAGSGLISLYSAGKGALVTATDINTVAIEYLKKNSQENDLIIDIISSDLFTNIPQQVFDIIAINPPYFKKNPQTNAEYAWYCGEHGEYFDRLFAEMKSYVNAQSQVLIILSDGCDIQMIDDFARKHGWKMDNILTKKNLMEKLFLFRAYIAV